ncbi:MAG TPA: RNA methyltransferase [Candidatus Kapabacteria bacterium]|nr:RNA methyltransferase [Candidatus Kapabacteria bacterium]
MARKLHHAEIAAQRLTNEEAKTIARHPITVVLDNIRSLYNVGSVFRTCDAARVEKLILTGFTPHPPRKEIEKTALGAIESVPWEYHKNAVDAVKELKQRGITIAVLEQTDKSIPYYSLEKKNFPLCLIVGNEISGVDSELVALADVALEIPMYGVKHSLNVAVACGIAVFEAVKIAE